MPPFTKTKTFRISVVIAALLGLYAWGGFWLAPRLARNAIMENVPKILSVTPAVGEIRVNPFLFQVEVKDFSLSDHADKLLGFKRFFVDFQLASLWNRAYTFANIDLDEPFVNARVAQNGELNLLALRPKASTAPEQENKKVDAIPAVRIGSFKVSQGLVSYDDRSHPSDFAARLQPINFELRDFTTGVDGGRFTFTGVSKQGERIEWHGHLSVQPIESDGEFQIDGLEAHTIWEYLEDKLNFVVNSGKINLYSTYAFSLKDNVDLNVDVSKIQVLDLGVRPLDSDEPWVKFKALEVAGTKVALAKRHVAIDKVVLDGLNVKGWREADGSINLLKFAQPKAQGGGAAATPAPKAALTTSSSAATAPAQPWSVELKELALQNADIAAEDRSVKPAANLKLAPLNVRVQDISLDMSKALKVALDTKINDAGSLAIAGSLTPQPLSADLAVKMSSIPLTMAQPYVAQFTSMTLLDGDLNGDTQVKYGTGPPQLTVSGRVSVAKLHTVDNALKADFINWDNLDVQGLNYQFNPNRLAIDQVTAKKLYARVIVEPDTSLNVSRVLAGPGATVVVPGAPGTTQGPTSVTAPPAEAPRPRSRSKGAKPLPAAATKTGPPPMPMQIRKILVQESEADFSDLSLQPNFTAGIKKLAGSIVNLSTAANSRAKIDLKGELDPFSPVTIAGEANVLGESLYTDLALNFRNIELATFNPYSGKFAGYNIAKGKLTTELHYKVVGRKLDAQHHVIVDQLEFGDKTESKDAVSLPIKLAVALLKDRNGIIDLNVPVTGSLDDPQFKLGPLVWKVFVNILEKAVTAPFALLGSLFGGGPEMQFVDFEPGAGDLDVAGVEKTRAIVKALTERPQLKIEVPIAAIKALDGPTLIEAQFKKQIQEAQSTGKKKIAALPYEQLDPAARVDVLAAVYQKDVGAEPKYPEELAAIKAKPDLAAAKLDFLTKEIKSRLTVSEADLTALAQLRATNVQQALLKDTQISPDRVFLADNDKAKAEGGKVRLELSIR